MSAWGPEGSDGRLGLLPVRDGRLPTGSDTVVAAAAGQVLVLGSGAESAAELLAGRDDVVRLWWWETGAAFRPAATAQALADVVAEMPLVLLPSSPDGRDLAPRLAAACGRPLVARALWAALDLEDAQGPRIRTEAARLDDRIAVPVTVHGPAVVTLASRVGPTPGSASSRRSTSSSGRALRGLVRSSSRSSSPPSTCAAIARR